MATLGSAVRRLFFPPNTDLSRRVRRQAGKTRLHPPGNRTSVGRRRRDEEEEAAPDENELWRRLLLLVPLHESDWYSGHVIIIGACRNNG
jgi:hypothetical protein